MSVQEGRGFKVVDNILIGDDAPLLRDPINVGELLLRALESRPDFVGQVDGISGERTTYADMRERSVKCALWLQRQGIREGDIVGICADNIMDAYVPLFATFYLNAIANPWDEELTIRTAKYFLSLTSPRVVFVNAHSAANVRAAAAAENLDTKLVVFEDLAGFESLSDVLGSVEDGPMIDNFRCRKIERADETCLICCSSGTTGPPKGAVISHFSLINYGYLIDLMDLRNHVSMWLPPLRWHYGLSSVVKAVLDYSTRIMVGHYVDDEALCELMERHKVTWFACGSGVPVRMLKHGIIPKFRLPELKVFIGGGSSFKRETQESLRAHLPHVTIVQTYGMTDIGGMCTHQRNDSKFGSCGPVCKTVRLKIVDVDTGKSLAANRTGEIWVNTPYSMTGYYRDHRAAQELFDSEGYAHSGDIGYYDEDGELFVVGRISEFILYKCINVPPVQIEALLESHPAVLEAAVVPVPHQLDDEHPMAFVSKIPGKEVTEKDLVDLVEENLEFYSRLRAGVKFLDKLPRTATGKIDRKTMKEMAATLSSK